MDLAGGRARRVCTVPTGDTTMMIVYSTENKNESLVLLRSVGREDNIRLRLKWMGEVFESAVSS